MGGRWCLDGGPELRCVGKRGEGQSRRTVKEGRGSFLGNLGGLGGEGRRERTTPSGKLSGVRGACALQNPTLSCRGGSMLASRVPGLGHSNHPLPCPSSDPGCADPSPGSGNPTPCPVLGLPNIKVTPLFLSSTGTGRKSPPEAPPRAFMGPGPRSLGTRPCPSRRRFWAGRGWRPPHTNPHREMGSIRIFLASERR